MAITPLPTPPNRSDSPSTLSDDTDAFLSALPTFVTEANAQAVDVNNDATSASTSATNAANSAVAAANSATEAETAANNLNTLVNYQGDYGAGTTYSTGQSVSYNGLYWVSKQDSNTGNTPATGSAFWEVLAVGLAEIYADLTSTANAVAVDCSTATAFTHVLTENTTLSFNSPPASGSAYAMVIKVVQDAGASGYTLTWPASVDWSSATAPTLTATASAVDVFVFYTHDGGTTWYGLTAGQAMG